MENYVLYTFFGMNYSAFGYDFSVGELITETKYNVFEQKHTKSQVKYQSSDNVTEAYWNPILYFS